MASGKSKKASIEKAVKEDKAVEGRASALQTKDAGSRSPNHRQSSGSYDPTPSMAPTGSSTSKSSGKKAREGGDITANLPLEDFIAAGMLEENPEDVLIASHSEPIANVVEQLRRKKKTSCIVNLATGEQEFFDCMDFGSYVLEVLTGGSSDCTLEGIRTLVQDWDHIKKKLRRLAQDPVRKALRGAYSRSSIVANSTSKETAGSTSFIKFDVSQPLHQLLPMLKSQRPVALFRDERLCLTLGASDVLGMCMALSPESKAFLEQTAVQHILNEAPGALSQMGISEDQGLLEVLFLMRQANVHVVHITASEAGGAEQSETNHLVGQFDVSALIALYAKCAPADKDADGSTPTASKQWWWEDSSVTLNVFQETCMDFISKSPCTDSGEKMPYAAVLSSEPLSKAISRAICSAHQSVVVYQVDASRGTTGTPTNRRGKPLAGLASTLGIVIGMLEAGLFQQLVFDARQPTRRSAMGRLPTLTVQAVQVALDNANGEERVCTRVSFSGSIHLDTLKIPVCPDHGMNLMRFSKEDESSKVMDFGSLKDLQSEFKAVGASASCLACERTFGKIEEMEDNVMEQVSSTQKPCHSRGSLKDAARLSAVNVCQSNGTDAQVKCSTSPRCEKKASIFVEDAKVIQDPPAKWPLGVFCCMAPCSSNAGGTGKETIHSYSSPRCSQMNGAHCLNGTQESSPRRRHKSTGGKRSSLDLT